MKYDDGDDGRDNNGNKVRNNDNNATSRPGSDGPIFNMTTTTWSCLGLTEEYWAITAMVLQTRCTMYPHFGIASDYISTLYRL